YSCNYPSGYSCCYPSRYSCNYPCNYPCNYSGSRLACGGENFIANKWTGNSREILGQQRLAAGAEKIPGNSKATFGHQMAVCCKMVSVNRLTRNYEENPNQCLTGGNEKLKSVEEVPWKWKKHKHLASIVEKHQIRSMCHQRACCDVGPQLLTEEQLICPPRTDRMPDREPGPGARVCPDGTAALINIGNQNPHFKCKVTRKTQMRVLRDSKSPHASYYDSFFHEKPTRNSNFSPCQLCCEDGACSNSAATLLECHG
uniref:Uncharacterized protein n=1 Tax=Strigamia maritima TaxID=126957 RepID=T1JKH5_STRMM